MTSVREDLGYVHEPAPRKRPACARVEGVLESGDLVFGPWCAEVVKADGRRCWFYGRTRDEAQHKAREWVRRANG